jgi:putative membrane protein
VTAAVAVSLALVGLIGYGWGVRADRLGGWPRHRSACWAIGTLISLTAVAGPLAEAGHHSFPAHMVSHLLLAMVGPLLLVLAAPVTLALRALPVRRGRQLTHILGTRPLRLLTDPVVAAGLSVGGLWLLYTTGLYAAMHHHPLVHLLVHAHLAISGLLFTVAIISVDPLPHRRSFKVRAAVLILASAAHGVLAKYLYGHPPSGVADTGLVNAEVGAMVMYYGGDVVELVLVVLLGARWYRATGQHLARTAATPVNGAAWAAPRD